jgi:hypothetical protein
MIDRIGQYQIVREVGRGGMGVVYLARDTRLDRDVAIKALPVELASDPARLERFEREARTLASLSHPNLAGIHGVEEQDGAKYLILEYVGGETLADMLDRGPLPVDDAVELAVQIAAGVEAAHDAGVIHRDLKPANIIITPDGKAKVLDFGLARTDEGGQSSSGRLDSPTMTSPQPQHSPTIAGAILGTAAYMSPEQARGRRVDKRTDIWSFGVVLYEMLVGASPFHGETASDSIGAVLHKDLDLHLLPPNTPANVRRVLARCLVRDKNLRYRDIGDVRLELLRGDDPPSEDSAIGRSLTRWVLPAAGLALIAVAAAVWFGKPVPKPAPTPVVQADIALPGDLQLAHSFMPGIAMSADGRTLAFAAGSPDSESRISPVSAYFRGGLYIRRLDEPDAVPVAGADEAWQPAFSPDGSRIAYVNRIGVGIVGRFNGRIETIAVTGGRSIPLTTDAQAIAGLDWTDDGRIIFGTAQGLRSIPEGGGPVTELTGVSDDGAEMGHGFPDALPGGRGVLHTVVYQGRQPSKVAIRVLDSLSGESRELLTNASNARYTRGHLVFARDQTIHAVPFDLETMTLRGEPRPLGMSVIQSIDAPNDGFVNGAAQFALSDAGDLVYAQGSMWPELAATVAWVTRNGEVEFVEVEPRSFVAPRVDAAGRRILLSNFYAPASALWMLDISRGVTSRVRRGVGGWVAWGPGPDDYTFNERSDGQERVGWATIGDTAEPFMLEGPTGSVGLSLSGWSPDGRHLLCVAREMDKPYDLFVWSKDDGWINLTNTPDVWELWPSFSPDGRWISYISDSRVHVRPFLRAGPAMQVSSTQSSAPIWSPDGSELYYRSEVEEPAAATGEGASGTTETRYWVMAAAVTYSDSGIDIGRPERLFRADGYASVIPIRSWDMGPDGRFLMSMSSSDESVRSAIDKFFPRRLRLIQNWAGTLGERVP